MTPRLDAAKVLPYIGLRPLPRQVNSIVPAPQAPRRPAISAANIAALRHFNRYYTRAIGVLRRGLLDSDYTLTEARVLYELGHAARERRATPKLTASGLCTALDLDPSYLSRILRKFETRGLLNRVAAAHDRRANHLGLTPKGRRVFAKLDGRSNAEASALLAPLAPTDADNVLAAMRQIEALLSAKASAVPEPQGFHLRPHRPGDIGWVIQRHGALYAQEYGWDLRFEAMVAGIAARFVERFDPDRENCWIAEDQAGPAGCVFVLKKSPRVAQLRMLLVEPRARGQHLGARLVDECIAFARAKGYRKMMLWTNDILHAARHIYQSRGFRLIGEEKHTSFGKDLVGQTWELDLSATPRVEREAPPFSAG